MMEQNIQGHPALSATEIVPVMRRLGRAIQQLTDSEELHAVIESFDSTLDDNSSENNADMVSQMNHDNCINKNNVTTI